MLKKNCIKKLKNQTNRVLIAIIWCLNKSWLKRTVLWCPGIISNYNIFIIRNYNNFKLLTIVSVLSFPIRPTGDMKLCISKGKPISKSTEKLRTTLFSWKFKIHFKIRFRALKLASWHSMHTPYRWTDGQTDMLLVLESSHGNMSAHKNFNSKLKISG